MTIIKNNGSQVNYFSSDTILDAQLLRIDLDELIKEIPSNNDFNNNDLILFLRTLRKERLHEFDEFFEKEGIMILILNSVSKKIIESVYGTGGEFDVKSFFPFNYPKVKDKNGSIISTSQSGVFQEGINNQSINFSYHKVIIEFVGIPLLYIGESDHVVGVVQKYKNGYVYMLPENNFSVKGDGFLSQLKKLAIRLFNDNISFTLPDWAKRTYKFEKEEKDKLEIFVKQKKELEKEISKVKEKINEFQKLKVLFVGGGNELEMIVKEVFDKFGYKISQSDPNRADVIVEEEKFTLIMEIKGLKKSAAEKYCAQLQKWVSDYHFNNEVNPKGILIVNTFKEIPIEDRTIEDFPDQMLVYVNQMKICLMTGLDLLSIYFDFINNHISKEDISSMLLNTTGKLNYKKNDLINLG